MKNHTVFHVGAIATAALLNLGWASGAQAQAAARDSTASPLRAPTADEAASLSASTGANPARGLLTGKINPPAIRYRDGTIAQELDESSLMYSVARKSPDGSISTVCVTGGETANRLVKSAQVAAKSPKEQYETK